MVNKIAFVNGKGGCGKTTSLFHVAGVLSKMGEKVLVIDLDKQRNTTDTLLMNVKMPPNTVLDFMKGECSAWNATRQALFQSRGNAAPKYYGVDCMVSDIGLEKEDVLKKIDGKDVGNKIDEFIKDNRYNWVLIDMPPANMALNEICFSFIADFVLVPFSSDIYSVSGYGDIIETIDSARKLNPGLNVLGVYLARYMGGCKVDIYIKEQLSQIDKFIDVQIPLAADVREAIMFGRPISYYREFSTSRRAYENLVNEIKKRIKSIR